MIHKSIRPRRVMESFTDGFIQIVEVAPKRDRFNTIIPGQKRLVVLGSYGFYVKGIHSRDREEFGAKNSMLEQQVVIPMNLDIHSGMSAVLGGINEQVLDIVKVYHDRKNHVTELLLARKGEASGG